MPVIDDLLGATRPTHINGQPLHQAPDGSWWVGSDSLHRVLRTGLMRCRNGTDVRLSDEELAPARQYFDYVRFERGYWGPRPVRQ